MIQTYTGEGSEASIEEAFRDGQALLIRRTGCGGNRSPSGRQRPVRAPHDQEGLVIQAQGGVYRPTADGTIVMPGSILYRWSDGYFKPTFHSVEIRRGDPTKFTIVAFLNFPDHTLIPRSALRSQSGFFSNEVQRHKEDDMNRAGDLAPLWSALDGRGGGPARME